MLKAIRVASLAALAMSLALSGAQAGEVTVKGVHLCCGACVQGVNKALKGVGATRVTGVACDRDSKTVTFQAADDKAAQAGIEALAKGGFFGAAKHGGKAVAFPDDGVKKGDKRDSVTFSGVHLCCGACVRDAQKAVAGVVGVQQIDLDREAKTVTLSGKEIDAAAAIAALNNGGFYGRLKK